MLWRLWKAPGLFCLLHNPNDVAVAGLDQVRDIAIIYLADSKLVMLPVTDPLMMLSFPIWLRSALLLSAKAVSAKVNAVVATRIVLSVFTGLSFNIQNRSLTQTGPVTHSERATCALSTSAPMA